MNLDKLKEIRNDYWSAIRMIDCINGRPHHLNYSHDINQQLRIFNELDDRLGEFIKEEEKNG